VALNCTHWALYGRKIGMMEKWKEIHINCSAIFQYSNIPITFLMYNKKNISTIKEDGFLIQIKV
jgi:hypothetical protein